MKIKKKIYIQKKLRDFSNCPSDDESGEKSVSVLLSGEESELIFIDHASTDMSVSILFFRNRKSFSKN